jgi:hypothetical protein
LEDPLRHYRRDQVVLIRPGAVDRATWRVDGASVPAWFLIGSVMGAQLGPSSLSDVRGLPSLFAVVHGAPESPWLWQHKDRGSWRVLCECCNHTPRRMAGSISYISSRRMWMCVDVSVSVVV